MLCFNLEKEWYFNQCMNWTITGFLTNKQTNKPPGEIQLFCADIVGNSIGIRNMKGHIMGF